MNNPVEPTNYDVSVFPLGQAGPLASDGWILWADSSQPLTVQFVSGLAVKALWFPNPIGAMQFYAGPDTSGTMFYETSGEVPEIVTIPNDAPIVTVAGPGGSLYVYCSTIPYAPFAGASAPALDLEVIAPIVNTGTPSAPIIGLAIPLAIAYGGTGSATPAGVVAGTGIIVTGSFPDQTVSVDSTGVVTSVTASPPLASSGGTTPNISLTGIVDLVNGGTGQPDPALTVLGDGLDIEGVIFTPSGVSQWTIQNTGVTELITDDSGVSTLDVEVHGINGVVTSMGTGGGHDIVKIDGAAFPLIANLESTDGSITISVAGQTANFSVTNSAIGSVIVREAEVTGTNPSASLNLPTLPAGTWLLETYCSGLGLTQGSATPTAQIQLNTGEVAAINGVNYERYLAITKKVVSSGSTSPSCSLSTAGGTTIVSGWTYGSFVLKATRIS